MPVQVLIVEDDADLRRLLVLGLAEEGFETRQARDGAGALREAEAAPDAVVMDIGLPDADGRDVCQALRARGIDAPVIFLTAHGQVADRLAGFAAGGDDYLPKPFAMSELVARIRALLKRSGSAHGSATSFGGIELDPASHAIRTDGRQVELSPTEFRLLGALAGASGEVVRRQELIQAGWPDGAIVNDNTLDVYLGRLRRKLREADDGGAGATIETVRGVGYRLS